MMTRSSAQTYSDLSEMSDGRKPTFDAASAGSGATKVYSLNNICNGFFAGGKPRGRFESPVRLKLNARPQDLPAQHISGLGEDVKAQQEELRQVIRAIASLL